MLIVPLNDFYDILTRCQNINTHVVDKPMCFNHIILMVTLCSLKNLL